jgi:hypothetical protein
VTNRELTAREIGAYKLADWIEGNRERPAHEYLDGLATALDAACAEAVREEREACAKVSQSYDVEFGGRDRVSLPPPSDLGENGDGDRN